MAAAGAVVVYTTIVWACAVYTTEAYRQVPLGSRDGGSDIKEKTRWPNTEALTGEAHVDMYCSFRADAKQNQRFVLHLKPTSARTHNPELRHDHYEFFRILSESAPATPSYSFEPLGRIRLVKVDGSHEVAYVNGNFVRVLHGGKAEYRIFDATVLERIVVGWGQKVPGSPELDN
jgi:hypothetical protein